MNVKINIEELRYVLDTTPADQNIMLAGRHGIGKSEILTRYFAEKGMKVIALFLGQMSDPGDLIGLPDKSGEKTIFRPPYWFPLDGKPIVLFLDELNRARPEVLQTIMDLALNRKLADKQLPAGSRRISAVNEGEEYQLTDLDPALVSRFNIFRFEPSVGEWLLWAKQNQLDERVVSFISENTKWLDTDPTLVENADTGLDKTPDRRAWKRVSDIIKGHEDLQKDIKIISSIVGVKASQLFISKVGVKKLVSAKDLLTNIENVMPILNSLKPNDFALLNNDVIQYIEVHSPSFDAQQTKNIASSLLKYIEYLRSNGKKESMMQFSNSLHKGLYRNCMIFIEEHAPKVENILLKMTAALNG